MATPLSDRHATQPTKFTLNAAGSASRSSGLRLRLLPGGYRSPLVQRLLPRFDSKLLNRGCVAVSPSFRMPRSPATAVDALPPTAQAPCGQTAPGALDPISAAAGGRQRLAVRTEKTRL